MRARDDEGQVEILRVHGDEMFECGCAPSRADLCADGGGELVKVRGETSGEGTNGLTKVERRARTSLSERTDAQTLRQVLVQRPALAPDSHIGL